MDKNYIISSFASDLEKGSIEYQRKLLGKPSHDSLSMYIGIPFCPTRCLYCSFTSNQKGPEEIECYLESLLKEIKYAGTAMKDGKLVTSGGRVLAITVNGEGIEKQRETIYAEIAKIEYEGKYCRRDIGLDLLNYKG